MKVAHGALAEVLLLSPLAVILLERTPHALAAFALNALR